MEFFLKFVLFNFFIKILPLQCKHKEEFSKLSELRVERNEKRSKNEESKPKTRTTTDSTNPIWKYFTMTEYDQSRVICNICGKIYSLGSSNPKHRTTGNIKSHLKSKHLCEYTELIELQGTTLKEKIVKKSWDEEYNGIPNDTDCN